MVTLQSLRLSPIENCNFWWGPNLHCVDRSQKERMEANVLGRHLAEEVHLNQRRWWLYNFWAPSKIRLKSTQCWPESERMYGGQCTGINWTAHKLNKSWARELERYGPGRIWARDHLLPRLLQNAPGAWGEGGGVQVKNHGVGLRPAPPLAEARVTRLATASFRDNSTVRSIEDHLQLSKVGSRCFPNWAWKMSHSFEWHPQHDALHRSRGVRVPRSPLNLCGTHMESTGNQQGIPVWLCTRKCSVLEALRASSKLSTGHSVKWGTMGPKSGWFLLGHRQNSDFGRNRPIDNACRKWHPGWD